MKRLGISVYTGQANLEENIRYIKLASSYGFKRIFTCLISLDSEDIETIVKEFKELVRVANSCGMEVVADVDPKIFKRFGASYRDLSFFNDLGLHGIRLDTGFSGLEESIMTFNEYGLKIELNCSNGTKYLDNILSFKPNIDNILGCHNFYPRLYTGLSYKHFMECSTQFKELGIRTAAFINSYDASFGPWPVSEGLCTLEEHRHLPIEVQAKHIFATNLIDDVIIANAFASERELEALSNLNKNKVEFSVELVDGISETEKKIILKEPHFNRGDISEYVIRSTQSRVKYSGYDFKVFNAPDIKRGDVLIDSSLYERYAGELQVALKDMKNTGKTNVVGKIADEEIFLLDYIGPWSKFGFIEKCKIFI